MYCTCIPYTYFTVSMSAFLILLISKEEEEFIIVPVNCSLLLSNVSNALTADRRRLDSHQVIYEGVLLISVMDESIGGEDKEPTC